jgi:hypothetical protein
VRTDDLVLEALEEELSAAARAQGLVRLVPNGGLAASGGVRAPQLSERRTPSAGRHQDLPESMSAEIAVELSTNSHVNLHPEKRGQGVLCSITRKQPFSFR